MWSGFSVVSFRDRAKLGGGSALGLHQTLFRPLLSSASSPTHSPTQVTAEFYYLLEVVYFDIEQGIFENIGWNPDGIDSAAIYK